MLRLGTMAGDLERETLFVTEVARDREIELVIRCVDRVEALAAIRSGAVDALVAVGLPDWFDFQVLEEANAGRVALVAVGRDPIEVQRLEVAGFRVLSEDDRRELVTVVADMDGYPSAGGAIPDAAGKLVAVWGPKGSPGRTTLAIELATALAHSSQPTVLIDADLYGGDIAQVLGLMQDLPGIVPLVREVARGDARDPAWSQRLRRVGPAGPALVPGLVRPELWDEVSAFGWRELLKVARRDFGFGVCDVGFCLEGEADAVDAGRCRNQVALSTMAEADHTVAVLRADPVGIKAFVWAAGEYRELLDRDSALIVANKVRPGEEADVRRLVRRYLGRPVFTAIPDLPSVFARSVWEGTPLVLGEPAGVVAEEVRRIAAALGARVEPRGLLTRIAGRRRR